MFDLENYHKAESVDDAVRLLKENPGSRLLSGGTDVLIKLREGKKGFSSLVDIHGLKELKTIELDQDNNIILGSGMTFTDIMESDLVAKHIPILAEASGSVGGPQVRNVATIGGNVCNGVTSADSASSLFSLNATLLLKGAEGIRELAIADFYQGPGKVDMEQGEVLTAFKITHDNYKGTHGHFYKYAMRNAMDIATIGCAGVLKTDNGIITDLRLTYGVAGPVPLRCPETEQYALGKKVDETLIRDIADSVEKDVNPRTSWRATKDFRIHIIKELSKIVVTKAAERAGEMV